MVRKQLPVPDICGGGKRHDISGQSHSGNENNKIERQLDIMTLSKPKSCWVVSMQPLPIFLKNVLDILESFGPFPGSSS